MMYHQTPAEWQFQKYKFLGLSLAGVRTSIAMPDFHICFDVAQGLPFSIKQKKFFISHAHMDHAAGVPYIISQKTLSKVPPPEFYLPSSMLAPLQQIISIWESMENHKYDYVFHSVQNESVFKIDRHHSIQAFASKHRIESYGYILFHLSTPLVCFSGDTQIEFLNSHPIIKKSKILFHECTYLDERKSISQAKDWGHTHLDEIIPQLDSLECERIVLFHVSSRYSYSEALKIISEKIPSDHKHRVVLFPGQ